MNRRLDQRSQAGFTLIELLVVLVLTGFLVNLVVSGFRLANDGWQRILLRDIDGREMLAARTLVRDLLAQAYPALLPSDTADHAVAFDGTSDQLTFLAPLSRRFMATDIVQYTLRFSDDGALWIAWHLDRGNVEDFPRNHPIDTLVISGLSEPRITYYGVEAADAPAHWQNTWRLRNRLPALIRMRMQRPGLQGALDQDLIVAPLITAAPCFAGDATACQR